MVHSHRRSIAGGYRYALAVLSLIAVLTLGTGAPTRTAEAGKAPTTYAALRTFAPVSGPGDSPAVTPRFIGNPDLVERLRARVAERLDAFCERIAFTSAETEAVFAAARARGLPVKLHADQLSDGGGAAFRKTISGAKRRPCRGGRLLRRGIGRSGRSDG